MADEPEKRRSWIRVTIDRSTTIKNTLIKVAPTLKIGSIFSTPLRAAVATAAIVGGPAVGLITAESAGGIDWVDQDPDTVELTILADEDALTIFTAPPSVAADGTVFDQILDAVEGIDIQPQVSVTVAAVSPEVAQFMTQIGTILDRLPVWFGEVNANLAAVLQAVEGIEFEPPPVNPPGLTEEQAAALIDGLEEVIDSQDVIEDAIFPGRGRCADCPEAITAE